ncbi:hypothetical protein ACH4ZX_07110 [Streptomyces sp. NPDC020490]|uniref:hypothetical protein n=1 Tax=Streptomyces sp. NPDC020490 TaxID=3365078 RepID=UPI0037B758C7
MPDTRVLSPDDPAVPRSGVAGRWAEAPGLQVTVGRTGQGSVESHGELLVTTGRMRSAGLAPAVAAYAA